jgi:hypothetical protein
MNVQDSLMEALGKVPKCAHKNRFLKCRECAGDYCARCIQLEVHMCPKLDERTKIEKENLSKKLVKVVAPKISAI